MSAVVKRSSEVGQHGAAVLDVSPLSAIHQTRVRMCHADDFFSIIRLSVLLLRSSGPSRRATSCLAFSASSPGESVSSTRSPCYERSTDAPLPLTYQRYRKAAGLPLEEGEEAGSDDEAEPLADVLPAGGEEPSLDDLNRLKRKLGHQRKAEETRDPLAPTVQGCLLAQALLTLSPAEAEVVVSS